MYKADNATTLTNNQNQDIMKALLILTNEDVKKYRAILKEKMGFSVGVRKAKLKRSTIIYVTPPKKQGWIFTDEQAKKFTSVMIELGLVTCLGDPFKMEDYFLNRSQPSFSIPA